MSVWPIPPGKASASNSPAHEAASSPLRAADDLRDDIRYRLNVLGINVIRLILLAMRAGEMGGVHPSERCSVGWLAVDGTPIALPVVQPRVSDEEDFYLSHGFDRAPSLEGTPYLDIRSAADGDHLLLFGHHVILDQDAQFSPVFRSFNQEVFDGIAYARWLTPQAAPEIFRPLMALKVAETFATIQRFRFEGGEDLRSWLQDLLDQADARAPDGFGLIARATGALTLCTCSGERPGQSERTLMVFTR